jgi:hypothetical protein
MAHGTSADRNHGEASSPRSSSNTGTIYRADAMPQVPSRMCPRRLVELIAPFDDHEVYNGRIGPGTGIAKGAVALLRADDC